MTPTLSTEHAAREQVPRRAAIVVNPTKVDNQEALRRECTIASTDVGWAPPLWFETTREDSGLGQTQQAIAQGADIVFAAGGDGTVRLVGSALADTSIPLGLMPAGTGNLLARNLGVPHIGSSAEAFARSLTGYNKPIDVGRVYATFDDGQAVNDSFLIMAGFGLDADIMDTTSEQLKKRIGWLAYPLSGLRYLPQRPERMVASFDDGAPRTKKTTTLLVGNCGLLTAGVRLMPDATADDGVLDALWLSADGPAQWAALAAQIFAASMRTTARAQHLRAGRISAKAMGRERGLELDGDVIGQARTVEMWISPKALNVRVPGDPVSHIVPVRPHWRGLARGLNRRSGATRARRAGELENPKA